MTAALLPALKIAARGEVAEDVPLAPRTSVRVGGSARLFVRPKDPAALVAVLKVLREAGVPHFSLGGGANTIVGDGGIPGAVLKLGPDFADESIEEGGDHVVLTLCAGAPSVRLLQVSRLERGAGVAWVAGIPGTVGGLAAMNAGTPSGCMADHLLAVEVATPEGLRWIDAAALELSYRHCKLPEGAVVVRVRCRIRRGTEADMRVEARAAAEDVEARRLKQPLHQPNSGSVFVNPPGSFAGKLIEAAGLKGAQRGQAQISERHANFIVNLGGAKASEVVELILLAKHTVREQTGIDLKPEVRLVGTFIPELPEELRKEKIGPEHSEDAEKETKDSSASSVSPVAKLFETQPTGASS